MSAQGNGFTDATFRFLSDLAEHNDSGWFAAHRETYDRWVDEPFVHLLEEVTGRLEGKPVPLRGGAATTFRMNRDVRFSADKSPYSTHRSGLLTAGGTKAEGSGLVYVQLSADGGLLAGGLYKPQTAALDPLRRSMVEEPERFSSVVEQLREAGHELDTSDAVKTMPRGYAEHVDHPHAAHLRLKQLVVSQTLPKQTWLDDTVADRVSAFALDVAPLLALVRSTTA